MTECCGALQLSSVLGASWWLRPMCQASLLRVPYSLPSPEALPQPESRARGCIVLHVLPKMMPFYCFRHFSPPRPFFFSLLILLFFHKHNKHTHTNTPEVQTRTKSTPAADMGAKVHCTPSSTVGFWKVIQSFFLCHGA